MSSQEENQNTTSTTAIINKKKKKYTTRKISQSEEPIVISSEGSPAEVGNGDPLENVKKPLQIISAPAVHAAAKNRRGSASNLSTHCNNAIVMTPPSSPESLTSSNEENRAPSDNNKSSDQHTSPAESDIKTLSKSARLRQRRKAAQRNKFVAMDCEMVGVGHNGQDDMLARVSVVNKRGDVLLDKFVKPCETVTDYRTSISGIRPHDIEHGDDFNDVQDEVIELLQGKVLVGHAIRNDLAVLHIKHPFVNIRDTSRYKPLCRLVANGRTPSLKRLTQAILGLEIQTGEHNSIEDARAAMNIYNRLSHDWEQYLQKHNQHHHHHQQQQQQHHNHNAQHNSHQQHKQKK